MNSGLQHPQVKTRTDRPGSPWFFRYVARELRPDGSVRTIRKYREIGPGKGRGALSRKQAEAARDEMLALIAPACRRNPASGPGEPEEAASDGVPMSGPVRFGRLARLYLSGYLARQNQVAEPTRQKEEFYLREYLLPKWGMEPAERLPDSTEPALRREKRGARLVHAFADRTSLCGNVAYTGYAYGRRGV